MIDYFQLATELTYAQGSQLLLERTFVSQPVDAIEIVCSNLPDDETLLTSLFKIDTWRELR